MNNADWDEILIHTRTRVREVGLSELDAQIVMDFRSSESSRTDFAKYFDALVNVISERSRSAYQMTIDVFDECLRTEDGLPIEGIELRVDERDYGIYGTKQIDLDSQEDLLSLLLELKRLRKELVEAGVFDE